MTDCTQVYHVAGAISFFARDSRRMHAVNVVGTENVLRAASRSSIERVVCTSSTAAVGYGNPGDEPLGEDAPFFPRFCRMPYMATKREAEDFALRFRDVEVVLVNPSTIFGAGDVNMNTGMIFRKLKRGRIAFYPPGGNASVSVRDCVTGHLLAMRQGRPGQRYVLSTSNDTYKTIFHCLARCLGVDPPRFRCPRMAYPFAYGAACLGELATAWTGRPSVSGHFVTIAFGQRYFSAAKARRELGWEPVQDLDAMMAEAVGFYEAHGMLE